jgi:hypothetical protein
MFPQHAPQAGFKGSLIFASVPHAADQPRAQKIDRAVRTAVAAGVRGQNIITLHPGCRTAVRKAMQRRGATFKSERSLRDTLGLPRYAKLDSRFPTGTTLTADNIVWSRTVDDNVLWGTTAWVGGLF